MISCASQVEDTYESETVDYVEEDSNGNEYEVEETETYEEEDVVYEE